MNNPIVRKKLYYKICNYIIKDLVLTKSYKFLGKKTFECFEYFDHFNKYVYRKLNKFML